MYSLSKVFQLSRSGGVPLAAGEMRCAEFFSHRKYKRFFVLFCFFFAAGETKLTAVCETER